jgi:hypothetical protein
MALGKYIKSASYLNSRVSASALLNQAPSFYDRSEGPEKDINSSWLLWHIAYIYCDSDNGVTTPGTLYQTSLGWPSNSDRWSSIANAIANTTIQGIFDDLVFYLQGSADFAAFNTGALTYAQSVLVEGNAPGAVWDDTKATAVGSAGGGAAHLSLSVPQTVKNLQLINNISSGTPRGVYCNGKGACTIDGVKIKFTGTTVTGGSGITGTSAIPSTVTAYNCILDLVNTNSIGANTAINLQTASIGNFYNCTFRGTGGQATNPDNIVNCAFIDFTSFGGSSSGNYSYCATFNNSGTNPVVVSNWSDVFFNYTAWDYRLKSGAALIGAGIGPTADIRVPVRDIAGNTRSGATTDVGAALFVLVLTITSIDGDDTVYDNQVANITGTGFGTVQGLVYIDGVQQSINSWTDTVINITVEQGALSLGAATLKVFKPI